VQRNIRHIRDFVGMKEEERRQMLRSLGDGEYRDIIAVCSDMPYIDMNVRTEGQEIGMAAYFVSLTLLKILMTSLNE
jgi:translocation protein SEC63